MPYLYHIKLPGMSLHEGYIGISKCYETRWKQHEHAAHNLMSPYVVHQNMRRYKGEYIKEVIAEGTVQEVLDQEYALRPNWMMAWNMAQGGGSAGSGWIQPDKWVSNELWHPIHGEQILAKDNTLADITSRIYNVPRGRSPIASQLGHILAGNKFECDGWQLRDAQLAKQVETWLESDWDVVYLRKEQTPYKVTKGNANKFWKDNNLSGNNYLKKLAKGQQRKAGPFVSITEDEYEKLLRIPTPTR